MPISFTCPHCGASTSVAEQYAGQTGPCARCGKTITIPMFGAAGGPAPKASGGGASTVILVLAIVAVVGVCLVGGLAAVMIPAVSAARGAAQRSQCSNNLRQIGVAIHNYADVWKCFPPAYIADETGRPMHSWRVLILPYLEQDTLYKQYDFSEPWDGPNNSLLLSQMPSVYTCPNDAVPSPTMTHYLFVVGQGTISDGPTPCRFSDVTDGLSNTLMVVEATKSVNWMEPTDLSFSEMNFVINDPAGNDIGSDHPSGANVLMMDGSVRFLKSEIDPQTLRNLLLRNDGNAIDTSGF